MKQKIKKALTDRKMITVITLCLGLMFCIFAGKVKAQEWFPVGAKWTYSVFYPGMHGDPYISAFGVGHMECAKDTVIDEITAKVLKGSSRCAMSYSENIFYYNDTADILYYYVDSAFRTYFDFSKKAGESYYLYFPCYSYNSGLQYDSLLITVDSVVVKPFAGIDVRYQYIFGREMDSWYGLPSPIIEYVGTFGSLYPVDGDCDLGHFSELRCYSDNAFTYYGSPIYEELGCDVKLSINEVPNKESFSIFPNPAIDYINIYFAKEYNQAKYELYDVQGRMLLSGELTHQNQQIDISNLYAGIYFIRFMNDKQVNLVKKVVKIK